MVYFNVDIFFTALTLTISAIVLVVYTLVLCNRLFNLLIKGGTFK